MGPKGAEMVHTPDMLETIRAFVAINLEISAIRRVAAIQRSLRSSPEAVSTKTSWVAPPNMHLTLRFFGDIDPALQPAIGDGMRNIAKITPSIRVKLVGLNAFPHIDRARILIIEVTDNSGALDQLAERMETLAQAIGMQPERRPFQAHITLARLRQNTDVARWFASLGKAELGEAQAVECALYESTLSCKGAEYTALERVALSSPIPGRSHRPRRRPSHRPKGHAMPPKGTKSTASSIPPPPRLPTIPINSSNGSKDR